MKTNTFIKLNWESTSRVLLIFSVCAGMLMYFVNDSVPQGKRSLKSTVSMYLIVVQLLEC
jgi:hypothetical protein